MAKLVKTITTLPSDNRYALYIDVDTGARVKNLHKVIRPGRLWVTAEAIVQAGLETLYSSLSEEQRTQLDSLNASAKINTLH